MVVQPKQLTRKPFTKVGDLEEFMVKASNRAKAMLRKECTLMMQCRCCANIFRRLPNFVLHKQKYCRNEFANIDGSSIRSVRGEETVDEEHICYTSGKEFGNCAPPRLHPAKPCVPIRRTNIVRYLLNKSQLKESNFAGTLGAIELTALPNFRRQVVVVPSDDGHSKCYVEAPHVLPKDSSSDEVLMVVPQDLSVQYCDMSLRRRTALPVARKVSIDEAECLNRIGMFADVDPEERRCLEPGCSEIRPFKNISALAYHVSMKHCRRVSPANVLPCMMCAKSFVTWETYYNHVSTKHDRIRKDHRIFRENESRKRGRKPKEERTDRSMSPTVSGKKRDEQEAEAKEWMRNANKVISNLAKQQPPSGVKPGEGQSNPARKLDSIINKILRWHLKTIAENLTKSQPAVDYRKEHNYSFNKKKTIYSTKQYAGVPNTSRKLSVASSDNNLHPSIKCESERCAHEKGATRAQHSSRGVYESNIVKLEGAFTGPAISDCGLEDFERVAKVAVGNDGKVVAEDCGNVASSGVAVVADESATLKTEKTQMETDEEWDGDSTKACKLDVGDEDSLDRCSTTSTVASISQLTELCLNDSPQITPGDCVSPQLSQLGGDDDLENIEDDSDSVGNVSTAVVAKTSTSSESGSEGVSTACLLHSDFQNEIDVKEEPYRYGASPDAGSEANLDVVPTPLSNFAPLTYFNYGLFPVKQEDVSKDLLGTNAHGPFRKKTSTVSPVSVASEALSNYDFHTSRDQVLPVKEVDHTIVTGLKRPRSLDKNRDEPDIAVKRAVQELFPEIPLIDPVDFEELPQHENPASEQYASDMVPVLSHCKQEVDVNASQERSDAVISEWVGASCADSDASRVQRCQRIRRLPARYRDDYVCALNDADSGDESVKNDSSACSSVSSASFSCAASINQSAEQQDLSSSQYSLAGTRWNAVFSSLQPADPSQPKGVQYCNDCGSVCSSLEIARRHVLSHIRLVRFVCKLCGVGGFFATDLRLHLMKRLCVGLQSSSQGVAAPVNSALQADSLCRAADESNPGAIVLFDGERHIVSSENINVHKPCEEIERRILERCV